MEHERKPREREALKNRMDAPETERSTRRKAKADAAQRMDADHARLGAEISAEERSTDESETADALKRAATRNIGP
jgi:hypothetical protein